MGEQKEEIILFGASKLGEIAYLMLKDQYNILYYCDNDETKIDKLINDIKVISPERLMGIDDNIKIIISSTYYREISKQLTTMQKNKFEVFSININHYIEDSSDNYPNIKDVNLGIFFESIGKEISLENVAFISGGSGVLDYAFLKAIALKFQIRGYLEIGSFIGESMDAVSRVVKECYSISLPDVSLEELFNNKGMRNFASYFMNRENVVQYKGDSKEFDFNLINTNIQFVFIDGDHSYNGVYQDTRNIFDFINIDETIVVWHDFKTITGKYRLPVINAVFDALPEELRGNVYGVDNNICGIYIPNKFLNDFEFTKDGNTLFSYEVNIKLKKNS